MRSNALKLSQPTVFACITFLLVVMNLEQAWYVKADVIALYHRKTNSYLTMHANGTVTGMKPSISNYIKANQCLETKTVDYKPENQSIPLYLSIYNPETKRYLCFTKNGKLVGRKKCFDSCQFIQTVTDSNGYMEFKAAHGKRHHYYISFNRRGQPKRATSSDIFTHFISKPQHETCESYKHKKYLNETTYGQHTTTRHPRRHAHHRKQ